jgi:hypothetical protein
MHHHTVILETPKREIPSGQIVPFVLDLISKNLLLFDYFGDSLDHQADYVDKEMQGNFDSKTIIKINFETEEPLDYDSFTDYSAFALISHNLKHSADVEIKADQKDISINLSLD